jgi:hypothetical protein
VINGIIDEGKDVPRHKVDAGDDRHRPIYELAKVVALNVFLNRLVKPRKVTDESRQALMPGSILIPPSEAAPCPLQPYYFDKWDIFADTWDCQYAMGLPVQYVFLIIYFRSFLFLVIFSCPSETVPYLRNYFSRKFGLPSTLIFLYFHLI